MPSYMPRQDWYDSDEGRAHVGVEMAQRENRPIDHGTARTIATLWDGPRDAHKFVIHGEITDVNAVMSGLFGGCDMSTEEIVLRTSLRVYLEHRWQNGDTGPVDNWLELWAPNAAGAVDHNGAMHSELTARDA